MQGCGGKNEFNIDQGLYITKNPLIERLNGPNIIMNTTGYVITVTANSGQGVVICVH